jgi:hypothetical protein
MSLGNGLTPEREQRDPRDGQRVGLLVAAGILLAVPIVALLWVGTYDRVEPKLGGFPFFFWYQFVWVFLCSGFTWSAYRLILAARRVRGVK